MGFAPVENSKCIYFGDCMKYLFLLLFFAGCKSAEVTLKTLENEPANEKESVVAESPAEIAFKKSPSATYNEKSFEVGNRTVVVADFSKGKGLTFINLHDDENTSIEAAIDVIDRFGGKLIQLKHTGERNLEFRIGRHGYEVDPNRIFTDQGARESLMKLSRYSEESMREVRTFAQKIVEGINSDVIFTLHNNTDENYSAASYLDEYKNDAADVFIKEGSDPDDFFFVTERLFFDALKVRGFNVVLQNNETMTDDGSLSVLAAQRKIPYINIEAQHGHTEEQTRMLEVIYELFN